MSYSSKDETIIGYSGLECVDRCYKQLCDDSSKVKFLEEEEFFRWPYRVNALFVWPWTGVVANVDGESISKLKNDLAKRGLDPVRVRPLSDGGYAVVEFERDWPGFYNAIMFEQEFEVDRRGKKDYLAASPWDGIYGWVARDDDYNAHGALGEYLQKNGDLKTVGDVEAEVKRKTGLLVAQLSSTIQELRGRLQKIEGKYSKLQSANRPFAGSGEPIKGPTFVVWDVFTCPLPHVEEDCKHIVSNIRSANFSYSPCTGACTIEAYGAVDTPRSISLILYISMSLLHSNRETHVRQMISGMNQWAEEVSIPANIMVISCEKGLSSTLENLHSRGYNILVVHPDGKSPPDLVATASCVWRFSSLLRAGSHPPYRVRKDLIPHSFGLAESPSDGRYGRIARDERGGYLGVSTNKQRNRKKY